MAKIYVTQFPSEKYRDNNDMDGYFLGDRNSLPTSIDVLSDLLPRQVVPERLDFTCKNFARLDTIAMPVVDATVEIYSNRVIDAIESVGAVDWTLIPARFIGQGMDGSNPDDVREGFSAVYVNQLSEFFDYQHSDYDKIDWSEFPQDKVTDDMRKEVGVVRKMILNEPQDGFPPYFRLKADLTFSYLSAACRDAIIAAGITSIGFGLAGDFD